MSPVIHEASSGIIQTGLAFLFSHTGTQVITILFILLLILFHRCYPCVSVSGLEKSFQRLEGAVQTYREQWPRHYYSTFDDEWLQIKGVFSSLKFTLHYGHWGPIWTLRYWKVQLKHIREVVACYECCEDMNRSIQHAIEVYRQRQDSLSLDVYTNTASAYVV
ncbi:hypothetical protein D9758_003049 [Tetrapyrgos nigripes]|uniref:Uncharacterized protein n=1 Tax=Tetrapyrgos nigripes TaxID=182062 RepID=A0A8H5LTP7_9AGAR|nr:hypothetical protein D9758_003049 [Tetrapyrgos nigripes]